MGIGDVEIKLNGKVETLRPTLAAALRVNDAYGGLDNAMKRVQSLDLRALIIVVAAGLNKKNSEVEEAVYRSGFVALGADAATFVTNMAHGGKPPDAASDGEPAGEE